MYLKKKIETKLGTQVPGVDVTKSNGKVTLTVNPSDDGFKSVSQNPNVDLGAKKNYIYHEVGVEIPSEAVSIRVIKNDNFADSEIVSISGYDFAINGYAVTYYAVGYVEDGENLAFDEENSWTRTYVFYDTDGDIISAEFIEVERINVQ